MMRIEAHTLPLADTRAFSPMMLDYVGRAAHLRPFITDFPSVDAVKQQLLRKQFPPSNRQVLVEVLRAQYEGFNTSEQVQQNLENLQHENTFTVCTAHQPSVFTGHLYFIYKTLHAIRLSQELNEALAPARFVPVFYVGSEDNDLDEIGELNVGGERWQWQTQQRGACGRMRTTEMEPLLKAVQAVLNEQVPGEKALKQLFARAYNGEHTLAEATRRVLNDLFGHLGLLVLDADEARLKRQFVPVMKDELLQQMSFPMVNQSIAELSKHYKTQASPRELNLFYLYDQLRERIEKQDQGWKVVHTDLVFSEEELLAELEAHPERFSPNVILRPLYQESILPNVLFVGGGGEMAYWMQLKRLFDHRGIAFPLLQLRQSFLWIAPRTGQVMKKNGISLQDVFLSPDEYLKLHIQEDSRLLELETLEGELAEVLSRISELSVDISPNLHRSTEAHHTHLRKVQQRVRQKFMSHLRRKETDRLNAFLSVKQHLFPEGTLQERHENLVMLVKSMGADWLTILLQGMPGFAQDFVVLQADV